MGLALSGGLAVVSVWTGLTLSYLIPALPPSSAIIAIAAGMYLVALILTLDRSVFSGRFRPPRTRTTEN
jgi:zinc/manganese transport system permease protein